MGQSHARRRAPGRAGDRPQTTSAPASAVRTRSTHPDPITSAGGRVTPGLADAVLRAQRLIGNQAVATARAGVIARQPADPSGAPSADDIVHQLTAHLSAMFHSEGWTLRWSRQPRTALARLLARPERMGVSSDLAAAIGALGHKQRRHVGRQVSERVRLWLPQASSDLRAEVAPRLDAAVSARIAELATFASTADAGQPTALFPLAFKYLIRNGIKPQLRSPSARTRRGSHVPHSGVLGIDRKDPVFPDLHAPDIVADLKRLPGKRDRLVMLDAITVKAVGWASPYFGHAGVTAAGIDAEWAALGGKLRRNIEGDLAGYVSVRAGLLNAFGRPADPVGALAAANAYYDSLVPAGFLAGESGGTGTLVHPRMHAALAAAEQHMTGKGWHGIVAANVDKYWSTSVRENRNAPSRLSQHSFGFAVDINPSNNPNLSNAADKRFIQQMSGHEVFYAGSSSRPSALSMRIRSGTETDDMRTAAAEVNRASDAFRDVFADEASLRDRLAAILRSRGFAIVPDDMSKRLDQAAEAVRLMGSKVQNRRTRKAERERGRSERDAFRNSLATTLWSSHPSSAVAPPTGVAAAIVGALGRRITSTVLLARRRGEVEAMIVDPTRRAGRAGRKAGLDRLRRGSIRTQLDALGAADRQIVANQVLASLQAGIDRRAVDAVARASSDLVVKAFTTIRAIGPDRSTVKPGRSLASVAVHGFANLAPELVACLTSPSGGNLTWLGVHNQDMHHFELKDRPALPRAPDPVQDAPPASR